MWYKSGHKLDFDVGHEIVFKYISICGTKDNFAVSMSSNMLIGAPNLVFNLPKKIIFLKFTS